MPKNKICKKVFNELAVTTDRNGKPIFSFCCYMNRKAWFRADSIAEALDSSDARKIRENALDNCHGYCSEECANWEEYDGSGVPEVNIERFEISRSTMCNARCVFCFQANYSQAVPEVIIEEWRRDYLPKIKQVAFGGGEPLVVAQDLIKEVVEKRPDAKIALVTNGILLDKVIPFKDHISGINISMNAGSREVYQKVLKVDAFDKVIANLKKLREAGFSGPISSTYVICRENLDDIENFLKVCKETGITKAGFNVDKTDPYFVPPVSLAEDIKRYGEEIGVRVSIGIFNMPLSFAGKSKQMLLYYLRYSKRRKKNTK